MSQGELFLPAVPVDPRSESASGVSIAVVNRRAGQQQGATTAPTLHAAMRSAYQERAWTDDSLARYLSKLFKREIARTTVIARRHELPEVVECGSQKNLETGVANTLYRVGEP